MRPESCSASDSKACREKMRRDRLNERHALSISLFLSLCAVVCCIWLSINCWTLACLKVPRVKLDPGAGKETQSGQGCYIE